MPRKQRVPRKPNPTKTAKTNGENPLKDPAPYLAKYRKLPLQATKDPKPMKQLKLKPNGTLDFLTKSALNSKYRIPKKQKQPVADENDLISLSDDMMDGTSESSELVQVISLSDWTSSDDADAPTTNKQQLDDLNNLMKDISDMESKWNHSALDDIISKGSMVIKDAKAMLEFKTINEEEKLCTLVNVDVFKLIAEKLNQFDRDPQFSKEFLFYKSYIDKSVTEMTVFKEVKNPVDRLQVKYVRLLFNYIDNDSPDAEVEHVSLLTDLVSFASNFYSSSFSPDDLFPAFYYAVQHLIGVYTNWKNLPWMSDKCNNFTKYSEDEDVEMRETHAEVLRRNLDNVWCSILTATLQLLQRSKVQSTSSPSKYGCR